MRSISDDELYAVQGRYLGPPGRTLPVHIRYVAIVMGVVYFLLLLIVKAQLRLDFGGLTFLLLGIGAALATIATMRLVGPERPANAVLTMLAAEIATPRPGAGQTMRAAPDPRRIRVSATRPKPSSGRRRRR